MHLTEFASLAAVMCVDLVFLCLVPFPFTFMCYLISAPWMARKFSFGVLTFVNFHYLVQVKRYTEILQCVYMAVHTLEWAGDWIARVDVTNDSFQWLTESSHLSKLGLLLMRIWPAALYQKLDLIFIFQLFYQLLQKFQMLVLWKRGCVTHVFFLIYFQI